MNELLSAHFVQEPYVYVQTLSNFRAQEFMRMAHPFIIATAGFIGGYLVRHLQSIIKKTYRHKRRRYY